jgi:lysophospholipase L1-like esterase
VDVRVFPAGSIVVMAARGEVGLASLDMRPITPEPPVRDASEEARAAALVPWVLLALLTLAAAVLLVIPFPRALEGAAWMLLPLALGVHGWGDAGGRLQLVPYLVTVVAFVGFMLPWTLLHRQRSGPLRTLAFLVLATALGVGALNRGSGPPIMDTQRNGNMWDEFDLPRIDPGLSYLQHPYIRRFNTYVIDHTFRGRTFSVDPAPGVARVIAVGTSSTWGHGIEVSTGLDYPTVLEGLLEERMPGQEVEVINGAVRGSTVARLLRVFRESLLTFQPDVVTLSVYFNDAAYATSVDEDAYLTRISRPDYEHTFLERVKELMRNKRNTRVTNHMYRSMEEKQGDSIGSWREVVDDPDVRSPPEHFEACIRAFAELGREHDFDLVLIKEAVADDPDRLWSDEFRAVMDRLGEEYDLAVVDPSGPLRAAGGRKLFMDDIHPLPDGHRVMAEVLAPVIEGLIRERNADR